MVGPRASSPPWCLVQAQEYKGASSEVVSCVADNENERTGCPFSPRPQMDDSSWQSDVTMSRKTFSE